MQNNSKYHWFLKKLLALCSCHGNALFHFSILMQSFFVGFKVNECYEILQSFVSLAHTFFLLSWRWLLLQEFFTANHCWYFLDLTFIFFLSVVYGLGFLFYPFHVFSEVLFSFIIVIVSYTLACIWEWRILCLTISLMPYFHLPILLYFPLSQWIGSS